MIISFVTVPGNNSENDFILKWKGNCLVDLTTSHFGFTIGISCLFSFKSETNGVLNCPQYAEFN